MRTDPFVRRHFKDTKERRQFTLIALQVDSFEQLPLAYQQLVLDAEQKNVNPQFATVADEFEARLRTTNLSGTTEVTLVYRCVDEEGRDLPPVRASLVPQTKVGGFGVAGPAFATDSHRDTILGNIESLVRHAPNGLIRLRDVPRFRCHCRV